MVAQKLCNGWRARREKDGKTFNGPLRATEAAANEDAWQLDEAAAASIERLQEVFERMTGAVSSTAATKHGSCWRARLKPYVVRQGSPKQLLRRTLACCSKQRKFPAQRCRVWLSGCCKRLLMRLPLLSPNTVRAGAPKWLYPRRGRLDLRSYQAVQGGCWSGRSWIAGRAADLHRRAAGRCAHSRKPLMLSQLAAETLGSRKSCSQRCAMHWACSDSRSAPDCVRETWKTISAMEWLRGAFSF